MKAVKRWNKQPSALNALSWLTKHNKSQLERHVSDQHFVQSQNFEFHCVAVLLPYHWSSWTVYVQQWGLTQRIPPFGDKLRHGLILRPKPAASSNTVSEKWRQQRFNSRFALHLRADSHHDRKIYFKKGKKNHVFHRFCLKKPEHIANFWQQACSLLHQCQSKSIHILSDLPGAKRIRLSSNIKHNISS